MAQFFTLLSRTWEFCNKRKAPILITAALAGVLLFFVQAGFASVMDAKVRDTFLSLGFDRSVYEELNARMAAGDDAAFYQMLSEIENAEAGMGNMNEEERSVFVREQQLAMNTYLRAMIIALFSLTLVLVLCTGTYYLILAVYPAKEPFDAGKHALKSAVPMIGVSLWVFLWIPIVNGFTLIFLLPRFTFAGVIYLRNGTGIRESARLSYQQTKGSWSRIVGNMIGVIFCVLCASILAGAVARLLGPFAVFFMLFVGQLQVAFVAVFTVIFAKELIGKKGMAQG